MIVVLFLITEQGRLVNEQLSKTIECPFYQHLPIRNENIKDHREACNSKEAERSKKKKLAHGIKR